MDLGIGVAAPAVVGDGVGLMPGPMKGHGAYGVGRAQGIGEASPMAEIPSPGRNRCW